jgi:hypothetical protein
VKTRSTWTALLVFTAAGVVSASADPAKLDLFGGYTATHRSQEQFHGVDVAVYKRLSSRLGFGADVAMHRARVVGLNVDLMSLMVGPRLDLTGGDKVRLFVRAQGGLVRSKESLAFFDGDLGARTNPGVLAGLGLDYGLGSRVGLRLLAEYYGIDSELQWDSQPRASLGVTYRLK